MNKAQRKLVILWVISFITFILIVLSSDLIIIRPKTLFWQLHEVYAFVIVILLIRYYKVWIDAVRRYPIIIIWLAIYGIAVAVGMFFEIFENIDLIDKFGKEVFFLGIAPLFLPFIIVDQIDEYRALGEQSNK
jgi:hypothetical protein